MGCIGSSTSKEFKDMGEKRRSTMTEGVAYIRPIGDGKPMTFTGTVEEYIELDLDGEGENTGISSKWNMTYTMTFDSDGKMTGTSATVELSPETKEKLEKIEERSATDVKVYMRGPASIPLDGILDWGENAEGKLLWSEVPDPSTKAQKCKYPIWEAGASISIKDGKYCIDGTYVPKESHELKHDATKIMLEGPECSALPAAIKKSASIADAGKQLS
jgi:hypothetical protein